MNSAQVTAEHVKAGLWLGLLGVIIFAVTLPMTKLAVGTLSQPQLSPWFITFGRAAVAGLLSILYLTWQYKSAKEVNSTTKKTNQRVWKLPSASEWGLLAFTACGVVVGFPLFLSLALQYVPSTHGAVVTGLMPLATAVIAAIWYKQRPSMGFWFFAVLGTVLVLSFMLLRSADAGGQFSMHLADIFLLLAMISGSLGYIGGARLTPSLGAERVICWVLVLSLPITVPLTLQTMPQHFSAIQVSSWWAFAYVAVFSMWLGFFAWYRGLALGGAVRVSQVQLVQPFLSLLFAVPLLGEKIDLMTLGFALAVIATVFIGKSMSVGNAK
ncbi:MAG TPA: DMT family transporter [Burkholderiaceae bacterium]|nr:DMT family transporter [Burkholderiaceae bacterium]